MLFIVGCPDKTDVLAEEKIAYADNAEAAFYLLHLEPETAFDIENLC